MPNGWSESMRPWMRGVLRVSRLVAGLACIVFGVIGLFLPVLQGILLLVVGLTLLSSENDYARCLLEKLHGYVKRKEQQKQGSGRGGQR